MFDLIYKISLLSMALFSNVLLFLQFWMKNLKLLIDNFHFLICFGLSLVLDFLDLNNS